MNHVAPHSHANSQSRRHLRGRVGVLERLQSMVSAGLMAAAALQFTMNTAEAQEATRRTTSRPATTGSNAIDSGLSEIQNPRLRAHFESNNVLKPAAATTNSESANRRTATSGERAEHQKAWSETAASSTPASALKKTPSVSAIQRASFERMIDASTDSSNAPASTGESTSDDSTIAAQTESLESPLNRRSVERPTASAAEARPAFLDLTGERDSGATRTDKAIGEHGAEVSVETSPQEVLYRAVAWIVIALCMFSLAALGIRKWQRQRGLLPVSNGSSRVLETLSLGPGRAVSLIEMSGYRALVAFDSGGIKQLVLAPRSFDEDLNLNDEPEEIVKA